MSRALHPALYANQMVDFSGIEAVGFDLDHTLALYDDAAVNRLAARETIDLLVRRGHAPERLNAIDAEDIPATRTMALDLRDGAIVKLSGDGGVSVARRGRRWLAPAEREHRYPPGYGTGDEFHGLHSPFDAPTIWFFEQLASPPQGPDRPLDLPALASEIRSALNTVHTRGELKRHLTREIGRFVSPAGDLRALLARFRAEGRRLFVVTNSHRDYAGAVLDVVVGSDWRCLFDVVVVDAHKPSFFQDPDRAPEPGRDVTSSSPVLEGANARLLERLLGAAGERVLYVGDNMRADIQPARSHGWITAHVVPELATPPVVSPWGPLLAHDGAPTLFARQIIEHAHLVCDRVDRLLGAPARGPIEASRVLADALGGRDTA